MVYSRRSTHGKWNNAKCGDKKGYVCEAFKNPSNVNNKPPTLPPNGQPCKAGYIPYWQACYKLSTDKKTWRQARDACAADGASLASIHSDVENAAMFALSSAQTKESTWIGLNDLTVNS